MPGVSEVVHSTWLTAAEWLAVLRIGLGLWWLESVRHKDVRAWLTRSAGIDWAAGVAKRHRWVAVRRGFATIVEPRPRMMSVVVLLSELAVGVGIVLGFLAPVALIAGVLLNATYFVLMIDDWAEQGQNLMMILAAGVVLGAHGWQVWSIDHLLGTWCP